MVSKIFGRIAVLALTLTSAYAWAAVASEEMSRTPTAVNDILAKIEAGWTNPAVTHVDTLSFAKTGTGWFYGGIECEGDGVPCAEPIAYYVQRTDRFVLCSSEDCEVVESGSISASENKLRVEFTDLGISAEYILNADGSLTAHFINVDEQGNVSLDLTKVYRRIDVTAVQ